MIQDEVVGNIFDALGTQFPDDASYRAISEVAIANDSPFEREYSVAIGSHACGRAPHGGKEGEELRVVVSCHAVQHAHASQRIPGLVACGDVRNDKPGDIDCDIDIAERVHVPWITELGGGEIVCTAFGRWRSESERGNIVYCPRAGGIGRCAGAACGTNGYVVSPGGEAAGIKL